MKQKLLVESLSMDLLRVALGLHRGSLKMADRFKQEALARYQDLAVETQDSRLRRLLEKMKEVLESEKADKEEDLLMYSTLFQNYAKGFLK